MKFTSLARRFFLWFIIVTLMPLALFGYLTLQQNHATLQKEIQDRLSRLADKKSLEIKNYLFEREQNARLLARGKLVEEALSDLSLAYSRYGHDSVEYIGAAKQFNNYFKAYIEENALFYDVFLITPQGEIIYTQKHESDFATNLLNGPYRNSLLAQTFLESRMTFESSISDFEFYTPSKKPAAFVSAPVIRDGALTGVLAFQLNTERIYQVAKDSVGLGLTGETALARQIDSDQAIFVAPLDSDPQAAFERKIDLKTSKLPMRNALQGERGVGMATDHRGRQVVAAWRYLPELNWGMVVKMDADEVFAPYYQQRKYLLETLLALLLISAAVAFYFGRLLVLPLKSFASTADEIAHGELGKRIDESRTDEVGALARSFNRMTENLQTLYRTLEDRVDDRTNKLNASNKQLQEEIIERKKAEEQLRIAAATFETHEAILITDANANIIRVNQAFQDITGYTLEEVLGKNPRILKSGHHNKEFYAAMWQQLLDSDSWTGEIWDRRKSGQVYPKWLTITAVKNEHRQTTGYVAIFSDITERKEAEKEIRYLAFYDALTKLPNRRLLLDRFRLALSVSARSRHYGAVLFLDMDRFKMLNDTLGHDYGDLMLIEVAKRLQLCVREVDTVARLGGDEFVVLLEEVDTCEEQALQKIVLIAEKIRTALAEPYLIRNNEHHSSPSIGACLYFGNSEPVEMLLKHADMAMYQAKESGRNAVRFFDPAMQLAVETRASLEADLRHAIPDQQLCLHYQLQLDKDHRPLGAEALVRWVHPRRGIVNPAQFIPIAEESSLIIDVGDWVLETACKQLLQWSRHDETRKLELAVNVSAKQFRKHDFVDKVVATVRAHQVNPARLKLELTESLILTDVADIVAKMHALKTLGIKLSLDDFGTGYSSLSYLKQLPLDQIKIDQSFVRDITTDQNNAIMVQSIIDLAQNFHLNVIAEGVETEEQLDFLKQNGCMAYQGYLFSKPVPIEELEALIWALQNNQPI